MLFIKLQMGFVSTEKNVFVTLGTRMMSPTTFFPILLGILIIVDRGRGNWRKPAVYLW
jgi:hypothetical protein